MEEILIVVTDVGSSKICTIIARVENESSLNILGVGIEPSAGISKGMVNNLEEAREAIRRSFDKTERASGYQLTNTHLNLGFAETSSKQVSTSVTIPGDRPVNARDIDLLLQAAHNVSIPREQSLIQVVPARFSLGNQSDIKNPIGLHGEILSLESQVISGRKAIIDNIKTCVQGTGKEVFATVLDPIASAEAVLTETERNLGYAVVDIGAGTTGIAVYGGGKLLFTSILEVAGNFITSDIAYFLGREPFELAEEIKLKYGSALCSLVPADESFEFASQILGETVEVNRKELANVIQCRAEEILQMVDQCLVNSGFKDSLVGLVLTGGSSQLPGLCSLAKTVTGLPTSMGKPGTISGLTSQILTPAYATGVGLLRYVMKYNVQLQASQDQEPEKEVAHSSEVMRKLGKFGKDLIRKFLPEYKKKEE